MKVVMDKLMMTRNGLTHENGFKYPFIAVTGANVLALIAVIIAAIIIY